MRVLFMGSPDFALPTLKALHESEHDVVAVYSQPPKPAGRGKKLRPCPVHRYAQEHNLPSFTPTSLKSQDVQTEFSAHNAEIAIVAAYGLLLPQAILDIPKHGCINVHPSALPRWRGAAPLQRTIMAGDTESAMCIMQMEAGLDTGDVLWKKDVQISGTMSAGALHDVMAALGAEGILETLELIKGDAPPATPQSAEGVTYASKITKEEAKIDWSLLAKEIHDHIRGLSPFPCAWFEYQGERIKILESTYVCSNTQTHGALSSMHLFSISCSDGYIIPSMLQRAGKKAMSVKEFLNGFEWEAGDSVL